MKILCSNLICRGIITKRYTITSFFISLSLTFPINTLSQSIGQKYVSNEDNFAVDFKNMPNIDKLSAYCNYW
jgi:hypothetical protein